MLALIGVTTGPLVEGIAKPATAVEVESSGSNTKHIPGRAADELLDVGELGGSVAGALRRRAIKQIDEDAFVVPGIIERVHPAAAVDHVVAGPTADGIVTVGAGDVIVVGSADQRDHAECRVAAKSRCVDQILMVGREAV